ncbi:hypothetical protein HP572_00560 [Pectobacterium sp. PL64]|uniref:hypothetical protein n=1 Tax=Pectobacterium sp. PL64 TaxID=2738983 RepID=UPI001F0C1A83|nr:hypothetical protein [Pectobacterium sp. PL64]UMO88141.1 hypothetical protein HP572_00560 [Pectobacterium sp. PL64]
MAIGDQALRDAFFFFTEIINDISTSGKPINDEQWNSPLLTYLMTRKQLNHLNQICEKNDWPPQTCPGITIYPRHIQHVLSSRSSDGLSWEDVAVILAASYSSQSIVAINKGHEQQGIILNDQKGIMIGKNRFFGMAIIEISIYDLAPVTAYHAPEAKVRAIKRRPL